MHGDYGIAICQQWLQVKHVDIALSVAVVRCGRQQLSLVSSALSTVVGILKTPVTLRICHVSARVDGIINAVMKRVQQASGTTEYCSDSKTEGLATTIVDRNKEIRDRFSSITF
eukprot:CFRG1162T1